MTVLLVYMQPVVTDRVARSVGRSATVVIPAQNGRTDPDAILVEDEKGQF